MRNYASALLSIGCAGAVSSAFCEPAPANGYVPTAEVAVKVGVAMLVPIFGAAAVEKQMPFSAVLQDGVWTVFGSGIPSYKVGKAVHVTLGGDLEIRLVKATGAVVDAGVGK